MTRARSKPSPPLVAYPSNIYPFISSLEDNHSSPYFYVSPYPSALTPSRDLLFYAEFSCYFKGKKKG
ncbi:hypothetical protein ACRALDRAFT_1072888 [Sodiomyces alcalophilus JCM 7366]|uniref:uncharacterized protein n=1 Tax=Sodiomyces alcalophilus JCM 7366 TaxID=591952 RepID=UPI0039B48047